MDVVRVVGPSRALEVAGVKLVGATAENGRKLLFSLLFVSGALLLRLLELTVRFLADTHGIREMKDQMTRDILRDLDGAGIGIASATYEIVGLPPLQVAREKRAG